MAITATVTFAITWVFSSGVFNNMLNTNVTISKAMYDKIDEIDKIVRESYNGEIDETKLLDSISEGYAYGLGDLYANYYSAEEYSELKDDLNGKVVGIGVACVKDTEGYAKLISVYDDSKQGTWYVSSRYVDWTGKKKQKLKRGVRTKKEAQE